MLKVGPKRAGVTCEHRCVCLKVAYRGKIWDIWVNPSWLSPATRHPSLSSFVLISIFLCIKWRNDSNFTEVSRGLKEIKCKKIPTVAVARFSPPGGFILSTLGMPVLQGRALPGAWRMSWRPSKTLVPHLGPLFCLMRHLRSYVISGQVTEIFLSFSLVHCKTES